MTPAARRPHGGAGTARKGLNPAAVAPKPVLSPLAPHLDESLMYRRLPFSPGQLRTLADPASCMDAACEGIVGRVSQLIGVATIAVDRFTSPGLIDSNPFRGSRASDGA